MGSTAKGAGSRWPGAEGLTGRTLTLQPGCVQADDGIVKGHVSGVWACAQPRGSGTTVVAAGASLSYTAPNACCNQTAGLDGSRVFTNQGSADRKSVV